MERDLIPSAAGALITANPNWLAEKEDEIQRGEEALEALKRITGVSQSRIARVRSRVAFTRRYINLLKEGFIPIPRMDYSVIELRPDLNGSWDGESHLYLDRMPVQALKNIAEFKGKFDEVGLVKPRTRSPRIDPILIGIIRGAYNEEHFILYYWRPELYSSSELW